MQLCRKLTLFRALAAVKNDCSYSEVRQGLEWLREFASHQPKGPEAALLSELFMKGNNVVTRDPEEAYKWAQISADSGDPDGINILGDIFFEGKAVPKNDEIAIGYWEKAASLGSQLSQMNLARALAVGRSTNPGNDVAHAYMWAILAASPHPDRAIDGINDLRPKKSLSPTQERAVELRDALRKQLSAPEARKAEEQARAFSARVAARNSPISTDPGR